MLRSASLHATLTLLAYTFMRIFRAALGRRMAALTATKENNYEATSIIDGGPHGTAFRIARYDCGLYDRGSRSMGV
jgi:hypothetical protein